MSDLCFAVHDKFKKKWSNEGDNKQINQTMDNQCITYFGETGVSWSENCIFTYDEVDTDILVCFFAFSIWYNLFPDFFYSFSFGK